MAMKKRPVRQQHSHKDDTVIYRVMIALGMVCIAVLSLQLISKYYRLAGYFDIIRTALGWGSIILGIVAVLLLVITIWKRKQIAFLRRAGVPLTLITAVLASSYGLLYLTWITYVAALYFLYIACFVLYLVALLYQREFFLLSLVNVFAGVVFYSLSRTQGAFSVNALFLSILLVVVIALAAMLCFTASKHGGSCKCGKKKIRVFTHGTSPLPMYVTCAVWLVCLIASALLGSLFAYYCVYAAVAFELISAVYYTVKLS